MGNAECRMKIRTARQMESAHAAQKKRLDDGGRQTELKRRELAVANDFDNDASRREHRPAQDGPRTVQGTDGARHGSTKRLGKPLDKSGRHLGYLRLGQRRGGNRLIGAKRRRHCHHRQNVPCFGHQIKRRSGHCAPSRSAVKPDCNHTPWGRCRFSNGLMSASDKRGFDQTVSAMARFFMLRLSQMLLGSVANQHSTATGKSPVQPLRGPASRLL